MSLSFFVCASFGNFKEHLKALRHKSETGNGGYKFATTNGPVT